MMDIQCSNLTCNVTGRSDYGNDVVYFPFLLRED